ncbi:biotin carboxylase [Clostridium acetireducens DSM 10703]|uniref:Biotin carboxylase n=1 Tax=Clostridium acetireducens DSM 10703 TaxID=1121290 RepID=A0A1E8EZP8_9CLOT|nr:acetyl-CoA carboxylase biotin carboxylase subunit [Clostridium acetireducens]OFI06616.1 biotin carboxylase [Clostridium acetireducens DSM 10703]
MFNKILIANRGEIAVRIIRACMEMGIKTVAIYSEADKDSLHTQMADEAICVGPAPSKDSYLNIKNIISATVLSGAEAVHPGFGFLSENSKFAQICKECNIVFIGPDSEIIDSMGNKSNARSIMIDAKVPVVPGSDGIIKDYKDAVDMAQKIGYPIMLKASAGGGGRGIRIIRHEKDLLKEFNAAKAESRVSFGDDSIYMEKYIEEPHHIEFQILADNYGNVIHIGERDCSLQRRNQKILEESPSPFLTDELRKSMGEVAIKAAKAVNYKNAGTIEFLVDKNKNFYFMEMNTRVQVEHPISEMVSNIDIIKEQIKIAFGHKLNYKQEDVNIKGHAIECRINAEDPHKKFTPSPGKIENLHVPGGMGIRFDGNVYSGYEIPHYYDSMIGKLIAYGNNREEAISRMKRALTEFIIEGVKTNIDFQLDIVNDKNFIKGIYDTSFIEKYKK